MKTRLKTTLLLLRGRIRCTFGFCPACNSDAPAVDACPVCKGYTGRGPGEHFPPHASRISLWWFRYRLLLSETPERRVARVVAERDAAVQSERALKFQLSVAERACADADKRVKMLCQDWADDHSHLTDLCLKFGCDHAKVTGDHDGVPEIMDLADMLAAKIDELKAELAANNREQH